MRRPRSVWLSAAAVVAAAAAAWAEDAAEKFFRARSAKATRHVAARLWEAADRARRDSLFGFAREQAGRVLDLDPDHAAARAFLGYVKRPDGWTMELGARAESPTENLDPPGPVSLAEAETNWRKKHAARAASEAAAIWSQVGEECAAKGYTEQAAAAFAMALSFDAGDETARRGLGEVRLAPGGPWISAEWARALERACAVIADDEPSRLEEILKVPLAKARSGHFRAESPLAEDVLRESLVAAERVYAAFLAEMGSDPAIAVLPEKPTFCIVGDDAQWDRWINRLATGDPGRWRPRHAHWARDRAAVAIRGGALTPEQRRDRVAHQTVHFLNAAFLGLPDGSWLDDPLAWRYAVQVEGTTYAFCVAAPREGGPADREWTTPAEWPRLLRGLVAESKDPPLREIVAKSAYEQPFAAAVKAWSFVDFLVRRDRAAFAAMARELRTSKDPLAPLETRFGQDAAALDAAWRKWVLEND